MRHLGQSKFSGAIAWSDNGLVVAENDRLILYTGESLGSVEQLVPDVGVRVTSVAYSFAESAQLVAGYEDGSIRVWDTEQSIVDQTIDAGSSPVRRVALSPDGAWLAAINRDEAILWDVETGDVSMRVPSPNALDVVLAPPLLILTGPNGQQTFELEAGAWVEAGEQSGAFSREAPMTSISANPGEPAIAGYEDGMVMQWDSLEEPRVLHQGQVTAPITGVALSPDGETVVAVAEDGSILIYDGTEANVVQALNERAILGLVFSPDGTAFATIGADNALRIWETETGLELATFTDKYSFWNVQFNPSGDAVVIRTTHDTALWSVETGEKRATFEGDIYWAGMAFTPDGDVLATLSIDGVDLWDTATGAHLDALSFTGEYANPVPGDGGDARSEALAISPDGTLLAAGRLDGIVWLWDLAAGEVVRQLEGLTTLPFDLAFSPDGTQLAASTGIGFEGRAQMVIWDVASGEINRRFEPQPGEITRLVFSPDGMHLASAGGLQNGTVQLWDLATGEALFTRTSAGPILALEFYPGGGMLAAGGGYDDPVLHLIDAGSGDLLMDLPHGDQVTDCAFNSDGSLLATASGDGPVRLWRITDSQ
jgi:WD40 repeat protein